MKWIKNIWNKFKSYRFRKKRIKELTKKDPYIYE